MTAFDRDAAVAGPLPEVDHLTAALALGVRVRAALHTAPTQFELRAAVYGLTEEELRAAVLQEVQQFKQQQLSADAYREWWR